MNQVAYQNAETDKPPFIVEAEQALLGSMLLLPENIGMVSGSGGSDLFYDPVHQELFRIMAERERAGLLVSPVALSEWANGHEGAKSLGGGGYLARLAGASMSTNQFGHYVDILADLKSKRDILESVNEARQAITQGEESSATIAGRLEASLIQMQPASRAKPVSMTKAVTIAVEQVWEAQQGSTTQAVLSGFPALDRIATGFYPGELILLGGRPSMGKTAVALSMALNVARAGHGVVICSLEMNPEAMALRAISEATSQRRDAVTYSSMRQGSMTASQLETFTAAASDVAKLPITFLSREFSDIGSLFSGAKQAKRMLGDGNMRLFIVDYAQLLTAKAANRYEEITKISMALKNLSGQLNVPVLALSQLSRKVEERNDKRPMLSDLRESGQLEQDADVVMFCYRDEYYLEREEPKVGDNEKHAVWRAAMDASRNRLEIIVAKQRQGAIGTAHMRCNPSLNLIWEG